MANESIDVAELLRHFVKQKMLFVKSLVFFIALGVLIIIVTRNHYQSSVKFIALSTANSGATGLMRQLGGLSGINLGGIQGGEDGISPMMYQEVIYSIPYLAKLSNRPLRQSEGQDPLKIGEFVAINRRTSILSSIKKYTIGLPEVFANNGREILDFSEGRQDSLIFEKRELVPVFNEFKKIILLETDPNSGVITMTIETVDPEVSAQVAAHAFDLLSEFVIAHKTEKAEQNLKFVQTQFEESKENFIETQNTLATFRDRNQNLSFSAGRANEERLLAEFNIASNLYTNMAVQLDQAKIKVQEDIPVLSIINPPVVSYQKTKPNIPMILAICIFMGFASGFVWALLIFLKNHLS
ncbi:G-rich domain on putative tyrosine kinase [Algoriphagus locisalis]|uniref:G-rich domain on putative tyrosine kinase n=1 Tax=Algoriphagus locisalis TaxID=305507 RepID=A0A1I6XPR3_9BACT|nr:hypothetical protein [Algoriphagus locisalis]SFT39911.1 G-rich domain on putative tyrosine kinase [Algoriphagus locisalis]